MRRTFSTSIELKHNRAPKKVVAQACFFGIEERQRYLSLRSRLRGCMTMSLAATMAARWCFQAIDVLFWDKTGAAALLVVAVAFTRLHDNCACCDAGGQEEGLAYKSSCPKGFQDAIPN